jgi:restriction system protein
MTVCQIQRNDAEERIQAMLDGSPDPYLKKIIDTIIPGEGGEDEPPLNIEEYAQDQIRAYIGSKFKGHELTRLVADLLKAQGYQIYTSPPGPDGGVDIIAGGGSMGFDPPRLCVQVKSGSAPADVTTLRELQGVMKNFGAEQGLFVSWSGFKESVYKEARTLFFEIRLWDSDKLVTSLLKHYNELSDEIQAELPLKRIWIMVQEE